MTDFTTIQPALAGATAQNNASRAEQGRSGISSDFETFLKMLTVQMRNQDPLNPIDATDYAVQLATFSSVEQQVLTNSLLEQILTQQGGGLVQMAQWVGMEARVPGAVEFNGQPVELWIDPALGADAAALVVRDARGTVVARDPVPVQGGSVLWGGRNELGQSFLHGKYSFEVESYSGTALLGSKPAESYARIVEARSERDGLALITAAGTSVRSDQVTGLRRP